MRDRKGDQRGGEWEPLKILDEKNVYVPNSIPTHLSSNHQGETDQLATISPKNGLVKLDAKRKYAKSYLLDTTQSGSDNYQVPAKAFT